MYHNQIKHCWAIEDLTNRAIGGQKGVFTYYYKAENFRQTHSPLEEGSSPKDIR